MYSVVQNGDNVVSMNTESYSESENLIITAEGTLFDARCFKVYETVPPEDYQCGKYCYTEQKGFYINQDWREPNEWNLPQEVIDEIKNEAIAEVQQEVINDANTETEGTSGTA